MSDPREHAQREVREMRQQVDRLDEDGLNLLFLKARSHNSWQDRDVTDEQLQDIYRLMIAGPTSNNGHPTRLIFARSDEAKKRLEPALIGNNIEKVLTAPACAIIAYDSVFYENLPRFFPHAPQMKNLFEDNPELASADAFRNGSLQGAYFMIATRAIGLDVGPISGFYNNIVDEEFFKGTTLKSNFLCNVGYGDEGGLFQKLPRPDFKEFCEII
ncbi:MAG: malonic semialdehyde reductase [Rhodospirillaceae bacterium]|jgi:3-hydroxypropanoate dehydrogenase|nr:malonic semialdehyde reductase [Rhodospirillaceae bacterium]MBT5034100.1 malonic semialdehyde reductase [Rhodospirillaceae bacterium]MBT6220992.1 malonic semialdehyde reductase [Rhodospirillaceae bacterium]MBT6360878.1 malonic semialdehyde reductase [Rhodospirillaceae bacterium]